MQHLPRWTTESSHEIPGVSVIRHGLASNEYCDLYVDSIRVYRDRVYMRLGIKFRDRESVRRLAAVTNGAFLAPDTIRPEIRYSPSGSESRTDNLSAPAPLYVDAQGSGLEWFAEYLIRPMPVTDLVFSADPSKISLALAKWTLPRYRVENCLKLAARYTEFWARAKEHGYEIRSDLISAAEIAARLAHLDAEIDISEHDNSWQPSVRIPLNAQVDLCVHKILPTDPIDVRLLNSSTDCYLLEVSGSRGLQAIALSAEAARVAEALARGWSDDS